MITCFKGHVNLRGTNTEVISDYISISRSMFDVFNNTIRTNQITEEEKLACELMAVMGTAFDGSNLSNRKAFYEVIETIAKHEKDESYES